MRVGIVGAGIAGLATAIALGRIGADVVIYERAGTGDAGAGISLFGNGLRALDVIGLTESVRRLGAPPHLPAGMRRPDGRWLIRIPPDAVPDFTVVHRADLQEILTAAAPPVQHGGVTRVDGTATGAAVTLESGHTRAFDLVVGADGIGSTVRHSWPGDPGVRYAGYTAWRGVTSGAVDTPAAGEALGRGERFGIAPMGDGRVYWFAVASVPRGWRVADERAELQRRFSGWHAPIPALLRATDDGAILRNDINDLARPLRGFVRGRVVLVGDAAHAMTPNLGQGGNQALEDAVTLAGLLAGPGDLDAALHRYDVERRARTAPLLRRSGQLGRIAQAGSRAGVAARNALIRLTPAPVAVGVAARTQAWQPPLDRLPP